MTVGTVCEQRIYDTLEVKLVNTSDPDKYQHYASQLEMMQRDREQGMIQSLTLTVAID